MTNQNQTDIFGYTSHEITSINNKLTEIVGEYFNPTAPNPHDDMIRRMYNSAIHCANMSKSSFAAICVSTCGNDRPTVYYDTPHNWFTAELYLKLQKRLKSEQGVDSYRDGIVSNLIAAIERTNGMVIKHIIPIAWKDYDGISDDKAYTVTTPSSIAFVMTNMIDNSIRKTVVYTKNQLRKLYAKSYDLHYEFSLSARVFRNICNIDKYHHDLSNDAYYDTIISHLIYDKLSDYDVVTRDSIKDAIKYVFGTDKIKSIRRGDWNIKSTINTLTKLGLLSISYNKHHKRKEYILTQGVESIYDVIDMYHNSVNQTISSDVTECLIKLNETVDNCLTQLNISVETETTETTENEPMVFESESVSSPSEIITEPFVFEEALFDEFDDIDPYTLEPMSYDYYTNDYSDDSDCEQVEASVEPVEASVEPVVCQPQFFEQPIIQETIEPQVIPAIATAFDAIQIASASAVKPTVDINSLPKDVRSLVESFPKPFETTTITPIEPVVIKKKEELTEPSFDGYTVSIVKSMNLKQLIEFNNTVLKPAEIRANSKGDDRLSKSEVAILMMLSKMYKSRKTMFQERIATTVPTPLEPTSTFPEPKNITDKPVAHYTSVASLNFSPEEERRIAKEYYQRQELEAQQVYEDSIYYRTSQCEEVNEW